MRKIFAQSENVMNGETDPSPLMVLNDMPMAQIEMTRIATSFVKSILAACLQV